MSTMRNASVEPNSMHGMDQLQQCLRNKPQDMALKDLMLVAGETRRLDLPWTASPAQLLAIQQRCIDMRAYDDVVCLPRGIASVEFEKMLGYPGKPKTWEYLLLCGPYGKYLLEGCLQATVQKVVFEYLDLLGLMWKKTITLSILVKLETRLPIILTAMEKVLPAWELDMNRHQMIHMVEAIRANGPCWAWAMFGFERFWKHLKDWMTQTSHPEATMFNAHAAFKTSCMALPEVAAQLLEDEADFVWQGHSAQCASSAFGYTMQTFDHATNQLILPSYLQAHEHVPIELTDSQGSKCFGFGQYPDRHAWRAELHLYYVQEPDLCKSCDCCPDYKQLWLNFAQTQVSGSITKKRLPDLLNDWYQWSKQQPDLCEAARVLCYGPKLTAQIYDRATIDGVAFATTGQKARRDLAIVW